MDAAFKNRDSELCGRSCKKIVISKITLQDFQPGTILKKSTPEHKRSHVTLIILPGNLGTEQRKSEKTYNSIFILKMQALLFSNFCKIAVPFYKTESAD